MATLSAILDAILAEIDETMTENEPGESFEHLQGLVTRLQSMVGFSQAAMFDEEERTWNERLIRTQLERSVKLAFAAGTRYFFGHPAPL